MIASIITQIASGARKITLGSLFPKRDFVFIKDIVQGFISIAEEKNTVGEVINIGSGFEVTINDTVNYVSEKMADYVTVEREKERARPEQSEVQRLLADNAKAIRICGWTPQYNSIDGFKKGLAETVAWMGRPENLEKYKTDPQRVSWTCRAVMKGSGSIMVFSLRQIDSLKMTASSVSSKTGGPTIPMSICSGKW